MVHCEDILYEQMPSQRNSSERIPRVLLVDDEEDIGEVARAMLEASGFVVLASGNGPTGLKFVEEFPGFIDLLLTDIHMPQMGGPEFARRARLMRPEMKVIYMSANAVDVLSSGQLEPEAQIRSKPFSCQILARKVREVLNQ